MSFSIFQKPHQQSQLKKNSIATGKWRGENPIFPKFNPTYIRYDRIIKVNT